MKEITIKVQKFKYMYMGKFSLHFMFILNLPMFISEALQKDRNLFIYSVYAINDIIVRNR